MNNRQPVNQKSNITSPVIIHLLTAAQLYLMGHLVDRGTPSNIGVINYHQVDRANRRIVTLNCDSILSISTCKVLCSLEEGGVVNLSFNAGLFIGS